MSSCAAITFFTELCNFLIDHLAPFGGQFDGSPSRGLKSHLCSQLQHFPEPVSLVCNCFTYSPVLPGPPIAKSPKSHNTPLESLKIIIFFSYLFSLVGNRIHGNGVFCESSYLLLRSQRGLLNKRHQTDPTD